MKLHIVTLFISLNLFLSCSSEKEELQTGPLISKMDLINDEAENFDSTAISEIKIIEQPKNLINSSNVVEKLTQYGIENEETKVKITTKFGIIKIRLFKDTPLHRANFIMLTKKKYFDST